MDYPGKVITKNQVTPTQTSASGNWTLDDAAAATKNNTWPVALVPNPISRSLRFNSADSAYLNRTPASAGNRQTWTWSGWIKRSGLSAVNSMFFAQRTSGTDGSGFFFTSSDTIRFYSYNGTSYDFDYVTTQVFRDTGAWYHLVFVLDTTNATSTDRVRIYVNGTRITAWGTSTAPSLNYSGYINQASIHRIGTDSTLTYYSNQYLTEVNFIDGQALTSSSFGMTNPQTGQWIPMKYTGTYGTNGFYLNFKDNSSTSALGYDYSGNGNNWTTNNFSVTAGAGNDSLTDVPTPWIAYNTGGDVGGVVRGNYCTLNGVSIGADATLTNGNLDIAYGSSGTRNATMGTFGMSSGKWYWEITVTASSASPTNAIFGITNNPSASAVSNYPGYSTNGWGYYGVDGTKVTNNSGSAYGATFTTNDVIGFAFDADSGSITAYKNGASQGVMYSSLAAGTYYPAIGDGSGASTFSASCNFGQRPFAYTPPAGFLSLCATNLPTPTIGAATSTQAGKYFNAVLYTGTGSSLSVTGVGFQPDLVWIKSRSNALDHKLTDAVRGTTKALISDTTGAETTDTNGLTAFGSDGFTVGTDATYNTNTYTYVGWNWNAGGSNATNTSGSITSTVRANTTAGFSIVTYTGTGANATVGHGLGVAPAMIIVKQRTAASSTAWAVGHKALNNGTNPWNYALNLNQTGGIGAGNTYWNNTAPTSSVFSLSGTDALVNASSGTFVAYVFAEVAGYSAFGSWTGNGSTDGPFVYLGFRPALIILKRTDSTSNWTIRDNKRAGYNDDNDYLNPNLSDAEANGSSYPVDLLSNGFKFRTTDGNVNTGTYIYAAFAESPFKFANAR